MEPADLAKWSMAGAVAVFCGCCVIIMLRAVWGMFKNPSSVQRKEKD